MKSEQEIFDAFAGVMKSGLLCDPLAITSLAKTRVQCNASLAIHPTIQVQECTDGTFTVGMIGILNGILEELTGRKFSYMIDGSGSVLDFVPHNQPALRHEQNH